MDIKSIIENKKQKKELTKEEIVHFISKYNKGEITDIQASSLLTLINLNGITEREMADFTKAISETGIMTNLSNISENIVDIHSIGGIDDKVSIILMCALSSIGIPTAKIAVRQLALCDKLKTIPGFSTEMNLKYFSEIVQNNEISIISEPSDIAPVENKLYRVRNLINCMDDMNIMALCIMGIKIALGANNIIFDISVGKGNYIKNREQAREVSKVFIKIGKYFNKNIKCVITDSNEPIGYSFGNIIEIEEIVKSLNGEIANDVKEMVLEIGVSYMALLGLGTNEASNKKILLNALDSGKAYKKFKELVSAQGGDVGALEHLKEYGKTKIAIPVLATEEGYIEKIDIDIVRSLSIYLNATRVKKDVKIDVGSGILFNKKIGDRVEVGEVLAYIHTNDENKVKGAVTNLKEAFSISGNKVEIMSKIIDIVE